MKATFFLPAHPSYFDDEYTQEEIDRAIKIYDRHLGGIILGTRQTPPFEKQFVLLRAPGKSVTVLFDTTGYKGDARGIEQYRHTSNHDLKIYVENLKSIIEGIRRGF